ncbi:MAG: RDD family protein [Desulfotomaculaceae bacterium]|nr:RDD family protein [Desulfotomaculaceae bacterium]
MNCPKSGQDNYPESKFCQCCNANLNTKSKIFYPFPVICAGFWRRFLAIILDGLFLSAADYLIGVLLGYGLGNFIGVFIGWLYFALMESSSYQGTLGKMAIGIKVTDLNGNKLTFGRATGRYFGKLISSLIFMIGYVMAGFTKKKQALHDIMAGCLVVIR